MQGVCAEWSSAPTSILFQMKGRSAAQTLGTTGSSTRPVEKEPLRGMQRLCMTLINTGAGDKYTAQPRKHAFAVPGCMHDCSRKPSGIDLRGLL